MLQRRLVPADSRLPLPSPVAHNILRAADTLRKSLTWTLAALPLLERFRACLAICVNYIFFCRAETGARCQTGDLIVDRPSQEFAFSCENLKATSAAATATS